METTTTTIFPEFTTMTEGKTFMQSYLTPVGFFAKDKYYTSKGIVTDVTEILHETASNEILTLSYSEGNDETMDGVLYLNLGYLRYNKSKLN